MLHGGGDPEYNPNSDFHIHYQLDIFILGEQQVIPAGVGDNLGQNSFRIHTHDTTGLIHVHPGPRSTFVTVGEFFDAWRNDTVLGNPDATFSSTSILGHVADAGHVVQFFVNGEPNTEFENYEFHDEDQLVIRYESIAPAAPSGIALLQEFDSGISNSDNITHLTSVQFLVSGVAPGASVELVRGTTSIAQGTASGSTITLSVADLGALGDGLYSLRAKQTVGGVASELSAPLNVTVDTTPPGAFSSTPPTTAIVGATLVYDANVPGEGTGEFTYTLAGPPTGASIDNVTGQLEWAPTSNHVGVHTFQIVATDIAGNTSSQPLSVEVAEDPNANHNPTAVDDTLAVEEDSASIIIDVLANDSFAPDEDEILTITAVSAASHGGTVTIGTGGAHLVYAPAADFHGTETFTYTISDGAGGTDTAIVTVTVINVNDPPTAVDDTSSTFKNTAVVLDVLANDSSAPDPAEPLTIHTVGMPAQGTAQITAGGTRITYTPHVDFIGADSFTYVIRDPGGLESSATVNINVQQFASSSLSGYVYFDVNDDGVRDSRESPIIGVAMTLNGTQVDGSPVSRSVKTESDGSYVFDGLAPGNYTIRQTQPLFTLDGKESVGSQGGTTSQNDQIVVSLAENTSGVNNNFGERGRAPALITLRDFYSSASRNHVIFAVDATGATLWHSTKGPAWAGFTNSEIRVVSSPERGEISGTNTQERQVMINLDATELALAYLGSIENNRLFRLPGGPGSGVSFRESPEESPPVAEGEGFSTMDRDLALLAFLASYEDEEDTHPATDLMAFEPS